MQIEEVVELGEHEQKPQLFIRAAQAYSLAALGGLALDEHQGTETGAIDGARPGQIDHQAAGPFRKQVQHLSGGATKRGAGLEIEPLRSRNRLLHWTR